MSHPPTGNTVVLADADAVMQDAARRFVESAERAIQARGRFSVALAGGSTPKGLYRLLASPAWRDKVTWPQVEIYFGDERCVPPEHPDSNYGMARAALLEHVPLTTANVHRMRGEMPAPDAALEYEEEIRRALPSTVKSSHGEIVPRLDLVLLGMGPDGHTASLFPHTSALDVVDRLVVANWVPKLDAWRISATLPLLCAAREVMLLVAGAEKAPVLRAIAEAHAQGKLDATEYPVTAVRPGEGALTWLLDRAAADTK